MFRILKNLISAVIFYCGVKFSKLKGLWFERTGQHHKVKVTKLALKAGDSYRLGECIVTLATFGPEGKLEVAEKIKAVEAMRALRERELTEKAEKIMLMSPEELEQFKVNEWLAKVKATNSKKIYDSIEDPTITEEKKNMIKNMKLLALIIIAISQIGYCLEDARYKQQIEEGLVRAGYKIETYYDLARISNDAISNIVKLSAHQLKRRGHKETAAEIEAIWRYYDGRLIDIAVMGRDIGWFEPISDALALMYELTEQKLGFNVCHTLRLDDLKTINFGLRVAFRPCYYGLDEYLKHLAKDPKYRGLLPVISYWTVVIGCSYATYGIGYPFICSPAGYVIERFVENRIAPKAATKLFELACTL